VVGGVYERSRTRKRRSSVGASLTAHLHLSVGVGGWGFSISEQLHGRNAERFRGGLVFKALGLLYHSTLGSRVMKKKKGLEG